LLKRYFIEVEYLGTPFCGFQIQHQSKTVQGELNRALEIRLKEKLETVTSSRTDTGVHARQNFLHFDYSGQLPDSLIYNLNAILPAEIVVKRIFEVAPNAHCRFDATKRTYRYIVSRKKTAFLHQRSYYYPFQLNPEILQSCAQACIGTKDFTSFSKRQTDVKHFQCTIFESGWMMENDLLIYTVEANRFLRGMVRALVGTMLQSGRGKMDLISFEKILEQKDCTLADFSPPGCGLYLEKVHYPDSLFEFK
jgi:tRNA pseudouridine38-40 synthase